MTSISIAFGSDLEQARDDRFGKHAVFGWAKECEFHISRELLIPAESPLF